MDVRLHQVAQHVEDLDRAVEFYGRRLGLRLVARFDPPGLAFFDLGSARLMLQIGSPPSLLYLDLGPLDPLVARLRAEGVEIVAEPQLVHRDEIGDFGPAGSAEWMAFLRDSEGNLLALVERRDD